jgi:hypothetical protein
VHLLHAVLQYSLFLFFFFVFFVFLQPTHQNSVVFKVVSLPSSLLGLLMNHQTGLELVLGSSSHFTLSSFRFPRSSKVGWTSPLLSEFHERFMFLYSLSSSSMAPRLGLRRRSRKGKEWRKMVRRKTLQLGRLGISHLPSFPRKLQGSLSSLQGFRYNIN